MDTTDDPTSGTGVLAAEYDPCDIESLALGVVQLVAITSDREPISLELLGKVIDVDAVDAPIESSLTPRTAAVEVAFQYEGYRITIVGDGTLSITVKEPA